MRGIWSRRARIGAGGVAVLALLLSGCAGDPGPKYSPVAQVEGPLPEDVQAQLSEAATAAMAAAGASGAIVGVWAPWSGSWVQALGTAGPGKDAPAKTDMTFRIADVTRLMTCDVLYALADRGTVKLGDPVTEYVSGVPDLKDVTLGQLCDGTSGLGSAEPAVGASWLNNPDRVWGPKEMAGYGMSKSRTAPGTAYKDSDIGYFLLGQALEQATGKSAAALIQQYVTAPLGLGSTRLPAPAPAAPSDGPVLRGSYLPRKDAGFDCAAPVDITVSSSSIGYTDSGVVSTIEDLGRYAQAEAAQALRLKEKPARFENVLPPYDGAPSWLRVAGGAQIVGSMIGQQGWTPGYLTAAYSDPASGFTVAVVLNNSSAGSVIAQDLAWQLAAIASKVPPASGRTAPEFALPFTAEQYHADIVAHAVCPIPPKG